MGPLRKQLQGGEDGHDGPALEPEGTVHAGFEAGRAGLHARFEVEKFGFRGDPAGMVDGRYDRLDPRAFGPPPLRERGWR